MKIDNTLKTVAPAKAKGSKGNESRVISRTRDGDGVRDEVDLTGNAAKLSEFEARLADLEVTDPKKVEAIRQAIADGTFKVDEEVVADALVGEAVEFISRRVK